jgi:hypothetical protein
MTRPWEALGGINTCLALAHPEEFVLVLHLICSLLNGLKLIRYLVRARPNVLVMVHRGLGLNDLGSKASLLRGEEELLLLFLYCSLEHQDVVGRAS